MTAGRVVFAGGLMLTATVLGWLLFFALPARYSPRPAPTAQPAPTARGPEGRRIKARLFYVAEDGVKLRSIEREVTYGGGTVEQARAIIIAQLGPAAPPLLSAVPTGTLLRAVFVTRQGEAFVDLSPEFRTEHPGGSLNELLTVYTIVNALTTNLPLIKSVQLLVDGKEVDTLAGHVDLRRPLPQNMAWVE
jgi:hypothetical protein